MEYQFVSFQHHVLGGNLHLHLHLLLQEVICFERLAETARAANIPTHLTPPPPGGRGRVGLFIVHGYGLAAVTIVSE
jgi:hypothetical protein